MSPSAWAFPGKENAFLRSLFYPECSLLSRGVRCKDMYWGLGRPKVAKFTRGKGGRALRVLLWLAHLQTAPTVFMSDFGGPRLVLL